ncbi:MAG: hypothetical protein J6L69_08050 [Lachnospiraceae bacterium]|nr:hypothetical protein [Lachnospiraceae bacterium]
MNNKRYYNIYHNLEHIIFSNIQILLEDVALIRDNDNGKIYARCIYKNLGEKKIKAIAVKIACYSKNGKKENVVEYNYLDLMAGKNKSFGQQAPIEIMDVSTSKIEITIDKVMYEDGKIVFFDGNIIKKEKDIKNSVKRKPVKKQSNAPLIITLSIVITLIFGLVIGGVYLITYKTESTKTTYIENDNKQEPERVDAETTENIIDKLIDEISEHAESAKIYSKYANDEVQLAENITSYDDMYDYFSNASLFYKKSMKYYKEISSLCNSVNKTEFKELKELCESLKMPQISGSTKEELLAFLDDALEFHTIEAAIQLKILSLQ